MDINLLIALASFLTGLFFFFGYIFYTIQVYDQNRKYLFLAITYLIGSFFFLLYGIFALYRAIKYPSKVLNI